MWECVQHFPFLYIHFMPGPLSHSLCALVWLLPVSGKDGKLQEGAKGACSVLWTVAESLLKSQTNSAIVRHCIRKPSPTINSNRKAVGKPVSRTEKSG